MTRRSVFLSAAFAYFTIFLVSLAAWITHVIICLEASKWGFLIAGAICFPIAIVHGIGHWFGAW